MNIQIIIEQVKAFYLRHRTILLIGFAFLLLMQICSRGAEVPSRQEAVTAEPPAQWGQEDGTVKPLGEIEREQQHEQRLPGASSMVVMMVLVLVFYVGVKKGWFVKLMPSIVWVSLQVKRHKESHHRMLRIFISNQTKESRTFVAPILVFGSPFKKSRKFRIKGGDGQDVFPITLMTGISHQLTLNLDQFKAKAGNLDAYKWVRVEVESSGDKTSKSFWKLLW